MGSKFSLGQKVKVISKIDENGNKKYQEFEQYVGTVGIVVDISNFPFGFIAEEPQQHYIYKLKFKDREINAVLEECLISAE